MKLKAQCQMAMLLLTFFSFSLSGQSIAEQLGGVTSNFIISSDSVILNDDQQLLIYRGVSDYYDGIDESFGYGYQSIHLEFISRNKVVMRRGLGKRSESYLLNFYDKDGHLLGKMNLQESAVKFVSAKDAPSFFFYSINFKSVPLVLLDKTHKINMVWHDVRKNWY